VYLLLHYVRTRRFRNIALFTKSGFTKTRRRMKIGFHSVFFNKVIASMEEEEEEDVFQLLFHSR
jgi:hypothetical protein